MKKKHLITLVAIFSVIICLLGWAVLKNRTPQKPTLEINLTEEKSGSGPEQNSSATGKILVHIGGSVKKPGVYKMKPGSRLVELIATAGGADENSNLNALNLAKVLEDGEKILVPANRNKSFSNNGQTAAKNSLSTIESENDTININTATITELEKLPGVGPETAKKIFDYREKNGYFAQIKDLRKVAGIGEKKFEKLKDQISCF